MSDQRFFNHRDKQGKPQKPAPVTEDPTGKQPAGRGSDPYNTSGSFDRKKNWTRVGKR